MGVIVGTSLLLGGLIGVVAAQTVGLWRRSRAYGGTIDLTPAPSARWFEVFIADRPEWDWPRVTLPEWEVRAR